MEMDYSLDADIALGGARCEMKSNCYAVENESDYNTECKSNDTTISENNTPIFKSLKHPHSPDADIIQNQKKPRMTVDDIGVDISNQPQSSPVAILNKICRNLVYRVVSQDGPVHCSSFTISVEVNGKEFIGSGSRKKLARADAARKALLDINHSIVPQSNYDFTSDEPICTASPNNGNNIMENNVQASTPPPLSLPSKTLTKSQPTIINALVPKSPINIIYETFPDALFECSAIPTCSDLSNSRFRVICTLNGNKYEGFGSSKKSAKLGASKAALAALAGIDLKTRQITGTSSPTTMKGLTSLPQTLADQISKLVIDKFNDLLQSDPIHIRRKVLAGIVMTYGSDDQFIEVITVSSGTKCISGERISTIGLAVNDCHAEVVSRRCLQIFLYDCLQELVNSQDGSPTRDGNPLEPAIGGGYQIRDTYKFHLYISTAPCGDSRIFSPHEEACLPPDRHPNRQARGQLRTKIESGEGTIPAKSSGGIQTWDGVLQGERLLTMSCSDKVARWNVLGVQGALLTLFMEPIYLTSIILGSLLHPHHLYRAVCGRLAETLENLTPPFRLNRPLLAQSSSSEQRKATRAPNFSVNWTKGQESAEIINAVTGKTEMGLPSNICKQRIFKRWLAVAPGLKPLPQYSCFAKDLDNNLKSLEEIHYDIAKSKATIYQKSKLRLFEAFHKADLGKWLKKPIEQDQFQQCDNKILISHVNNYNTPNL